MGRRKALKNIGLGLSGAMLSKPASSFINKDTFLEKKNFSGNRLDSGHKIAKIRYYKAPDWKGINVNQSQGIVEVETDSGHIGIGEGGTHDLVKQLAERLIGEDPFRIEYFWEYMHRSMFYPPGRDKMHGLGAPDMAFWGLKRESTRSSGL